MSNERKHLFLDDVRMPSDAANYMRPSMANIYRKEKWDIVRNFDQFVQYLKTHGVPYCVSFDHDLADEHYRESMYNPDGHYNKYYDDGTFKEKTGYECARILLKFCLGSKIPLPKIIICHSMNPIGKKNIYSVFQDVCPENLF